MLIESVRCFRNVFPGNPVCVCDDPDKPVPWEVIDLINPDHYECRKWKVRGGLRGWEVVFGILEFTERMVEKYGTAGSLKLDCDTLVLNSGWIDLEKALCGWHLGGVWYAAGLARFLQRGVAGRVDRELRYQWRWDFIKPPEDQMISTEVLRLFAPETVQILPWRTKKEGAPYATTWLGAEGWTKDPMKASVLHVSTKRRRNCDGVEACALQMNEINRALEQAPQPT